MESERAREQEMKGIACRTDSGTNIFDLNFKSCPMHRCMGWLEKIEKQCQKCSFFRRIVSPSGFPQQEWQTLLMNRPRKTPHDDSIKNADQMVLRTQPTCLCVQQKGSRKMDSSSTRHSASLCLPTREREGAIEREREREREREDRERRQREKARRERERERDQAREHAHRQVSRTLCVSDVALRWDPNPQVMDQVQGLSSCFLKFLPTNCAVQGATRRI